MEPDDIHAAGMILMFVATLGVTVVFGRKPQKNLLWLRLIIAISVGVITIFALPLNFIIHFKSQASSNPVSQSLLASLCLIIVILFVRKQVIITACCVVILA